MRDQKPLIKSDWHKDASVPRILPFAIFMAFIGAEELSGLLESNGLLHLGRTFPLIIYPIKTLATAAVLIFYMPRYSEIRWADFSRVLCTLASVATGLLVFLIWVNLDYSLGTAAGGFNPTIIENRMAVLLMIGFKLAGATLVVPIMEELFWRSFLIRYLISKNFDRVPIGQFTWPSFMIGSILFGLEHHLLLAGVVAGIAYSLLLYRTKSIAQCVLSHSTTNLALGVYVLWTGQWRFW